MPQQHILRSYHFIAEVTFKSDDDSAIKEHLLFCNHTPDFEDSSILVANNNHFKVMLMESLLINKDHPPLNKNKQSLPLKLFDG